MEKRTFVSDDKSTGFQKMYRDLRNRKKLNAKAEEPEKYKAPAKKRTKGEK